MQRCLATGIVLLLCLPNARQAAAAPQGQFEQITRTYQFLISDAVIAGHHRVPIELFDPEKGTLREAAIEIQGNLTVGANTSPHIVKGVPVPYPIGFTLKQVFEGPFTVGKGDWTNLEGLFFYSGTAPGTGGYVGFSDRSFSYRVVINESTDAHGVALPEARGPDVAPGPVGGILFSFISGPETEGYVSWVGALLGGEDLNMQEGRIYFPVVGAAGNVTITYRFTPAFPDVNTIPAAPPEPVPIPYPSIRNE